MGALRLLTALLLIVATAARAFPTTPLHRITQQMAQRPLDRVEGVWRFPVGRSLVAIEKTAPGEYEARVIQADNRSLLPGTVIGILRATAKPEVYSARLFTSTARVPDGTETLASAKECILTLTHSDSRLELQQIRRGVKINWWRLLPYMFRGLITPVDNTPANLNGWIRLYPTPAPPASPRYL